MQRGITASLGVLHTREIAPYPYAHPPSSRARARPACTRRPVWITFSKAAASFVLIEDPATLDFPFAVVAHRMANQRPIPSAFAEAPDPE